MGQHGSRHDYNGRNTSAMLTYRNLVCASDELFAAWSALSNVRTDITAAAHKL